MINMNQQALRKSLGHGVVLLENIDFSHMEYFLYHSAYGMSDEVLKAVGIGERILMLIDPCLGFAPGKLNMYERRCFHSKREQFFASPEHFPDMIHCGRVVLITNDSDEL